MDRCCVSVRPSNGIGRTCTDDRSGARLHSGSRTFNSRGPESRVGIATVPFRNGSTTHCVTGQGEVLGDGTERISYLPRMIIGCVETLISIERDAAYTSIGRVHSTILFSSFLPPGLLALSYSMAAEALSLDVHGTMYILIELSGSVSYHTLVVHIVTFRNLAGFSFILFFPACGSFSTIVLLREASLLELVRKL